MHNNNVNPSTKLAVTQNTYLITVHVIGIAMVEHSAK